MDEMKRFGAYYGSFVIRFTRKWSGHRLSFHAGETWVLHERQVLAAKAKQTLTVDYSEVFPEYYELLAHFPKHKDDA